MIGFGLYLSWQTILMNPSLMPQPNPDYHIGAVFYVQESLFLLLLVGTAVWTIRRKGFSHRRLALWVSAAVLFVGTCMQYGFAHMEETNAAVAHIGYLASCMRFVPVVLWGEMICTIPPKDSLFCIAGGYALSFAANLIATYLQAPAAFMFHALLPLASALAFSSLAPWPFPPSIRGSSRIALEKLPWNFFVGIGLFGFVMKLLFYFSEAKVSAPDEYATVVAGIVVAVAFACFAKGYRSEIDYTTLYRFITPTVILLALAVALSQADHQSYEAFFIGGVWTFYKIFSWSLWRNISYRVTYPDSAVFALGYAVLDVCTYAPALLVDVLPFPDQNLLEMALIVVAALGISIFLLREEHISKLFTRNKRVARPAEQAAGKDAQADGMRAAADEFHLTEREQEIALLVLQGTGNQSIQETLFITKNTLRTHLHNIYDKTNVHSKQELIELLLTFQD